MNAEDGIDTHEAKTKKNIADLERMLSKNKELSDSEDEVKDVFAGMIKKSTAKQIL
jgi:ferritin-like metal-binding protein YciE